MMQWLVNNSVYITMSGENANAAMVQVLVKMVKECKRRHNAAKEKKI